MNFIKIKKWIELNEKSFIESYFIIIKKLKNIYQEYNNDGKELNITELEQLFKIKFYVDNIKINNPLIYGCNELKYAGLIIIYISICLIKEIMKA